MAIPKDTPKRTDGIADLIDEILCIEVADESSAHSYKRMTEIVSQP